MKKLIILTLFLISLTTFGQSKVKYLQFTPTVDTAGSIYKASGTIVRHLDNNLYYKKSGTWQSLNSAGGGSNLYFKNGLTKQADSTTVELGGNITHFTQIGNVNETGFSLLPTPLGNYFDLQVHKTNSSNHYTQVLGDLTGLYLNNNGGIISAYTGKYDGSNFDERLTIDSIGNISMPNSQTLTANITDYSSDSTLITKGWAKSHLGGGVSYKVYIAHVRQTTPTGNPVATVLENTLGGTVVWTRNTAGYYTATLAGAFTANKTWVLATTDWAGGAFVIAPDPTASPPNSLDIYNTDGGSQVDGFDCYIEIRVYP